MKERESSEPVPANPDTVGTATPYHGKETEKGLQVGNLGIGEAVKAMEAGRRCAREGWGVTGAFVFRQVPSEVPVDIIPRMTSLPKEVKDILEARGKPIVYENQYAIVFPDSRINGWAPSVSDAQSNDWYILPERDRPGYLQRADEELAQLTERIRKLEAFLDSNPPIEKAVLLDLQLVQMEAYRDTLTARIEHMNEATTPAPA